MRKIFLNFLKNKIKFRSFIFFAATLFSVFTAFGQITNPTPPNVIPPLPTNPQANAPISREQAVQMTLRQVSGYNQARLNERVAAEDLIQAKAALYPKITANPGLIYTSPSLANGNPNGIVHPPSFLGANAVSEYQGLITAAGEIDFSGRLRATIRRSQALLEAARSGTEAARRALIENLDEAYLNLALAATKRTAAAENLRVAEDFENLTRLLAEGGEVPPVDSVRAEVQIAARRDELSQAELAEQQAADALRVFIGYDFAQPVAVADLLTSVPDEAELENLTNGASDQTRPEISQLNAEKRAAAQDVKIAEAQRRPQLTYLLNGGFVSNSLLPRPIFSTLGAQATIGVTIPIFDFGISKSREAQARLRRQAAEQTKIFTERMLAQQYRSAVLQAQSARNRIHLLGDSIKKAEKVVEVSTFRYRAGEAPITEVIDAQTQLITQRAALYQAIYDYQIALARLRQAVGK